MLVGCLSAFRIHRAAAWRHMRHREQCNNAPVWHLNGRRNKTGPVIATPAKIIEGANLRLLLNGEKKIHIDTPRAYSETGHLMTTADGHPSFGRPLNGGGLRFTIELRERPRHLPKDITTQMHQVIRAPYTSAFRALARETPVRHTLPKLAIRKRIVSRTSPPLYQ